MDKRISDLFMRWQKRNISAVYCANKEQAAGRVLEIIPPRAEVGFSGSVTLDQLGIIRSLEARGNKVFNPYKGSMSRQESLLVRRQGAQAEFYLASANAVSENGELVFFSAYGNRTSGIAYAQRVIIVTGINKLTPNLNEAIKRAREYATPLNCKRLDFHTPCFAEGICQEGICLFPEYKRMCCQILLIEAEIAPGRLEVILVGENLGF